MFYPQWDNKAWSSVAELLSVSNYSESGKSSSISVSVHLTLHSHSTFTTSTSSPTNSFILITKRCRTLDAALILIDFKASHLKKKLRLTRFWKLLIFLAVFLHRTIFHWQFRQSRLGHHVISTKTNAFRVFYLNSYWSINVCMEFIFFHNNYK